MNALRLLVGICIGLSAIALVILFDESIFLISACLFFILIATATVAFLRPLLHLIATVIGIYALGLLFIWAFGGIW